MGDSRKAHVNTRKSVLPWRGRSRFGNAASDTARRRPLLTRLGAGVGQAPLLQLRAPGLVRGKPIGSQPLGYYPLLPHAGRWRGASRLLLPSGRKPLLRLRTSRASAGRAPLLLPLWGKLSAKLAGGFVPFVV